MRRSMHGAWRGELSAQSPSDTRCHSVFATALRAHISGGVGSAAGRGKAAEVHLAEALQHAADVSGHLPPLSGRQHGGRVAVHKEGMAGLG